MRRALPLLLCPGMPWAAADGSSRPHIITIIADDFGWANIGYHRTEGDGGAPNEVVTPNLDALAADGIELDRHYAFRICSPSRSSFQTGRLPVHVNTANADPTVYNPSDPIGGYAGIPVNMTGIAQKLRAAGYRTHMVGKWDAGMATLRHTPVGRGYESWLGYFHHANDYWNESIPIAATGNVDVCGNKYLDLWDTDKPAHGMTSTGAYEEELFTNRTLKVLAAHDPAEPLFLVHAFHVLHTPLEAPQDYFDAFAFIDNEQRQKYAAMVKYMDDAVGTIVAAVKGKGMWNATLTVFTSDNGGPIYTKWPLHGGAGANNWPLKGGKYSDWEGGVRTNAFVSGGFIPAARRGTKLEALMHIADWYATFCGLAGVDAADAEAATAGLPGVDSIDQWPVISGVNTTAQRQELQLSTQALIQGKHKLLVGTEDISNWMGPSFPNNTCKGVVPWKCQPLFPGISPTGLWQHNCKDGELYDVYADPTEHSDIAAAHPSIAKAMAARLQELNGAVYAPKRGTGTKLACSAAEKYGGFYGPFIGVNGPSPAASTYVCQGGRCVAGEGGATLAKCQAMCG